MTMNAAAPCARAPAAAPARMAPALVWLFALACGLSVANVYYAQPLLDAVAREFGFAESAVGIVVTATQAGCALALLLLVPVGDLMDRRRLILAQLLLLAVALGAVSLAGTRAALLAGMLAVGLLGTAMTQGLLAARALAGVLADLAGWRAVYATSGVLALLLFAVLVRRLPRQAIAPARLGYARLLGSMFVLLLGERTLQIRGVLAMLMFAAFSAFWTTLVLPLSAPPHAMSHTAIGAFGLVGAAGALAAARTGRLADRGLGQRTTGVALVLLLACWLPLALAPQSLWLLVAGVLVLDLAGQAIHVTNQSLVFRVRPEAHGRMVGCYMLFYALGSGAGAIASTHVYARAGWSGVCVLGAVISLAALVFWALTLRAMPAQAGQP
ncbi:MULTISPECIES: MFS transporter [Cupriavidus]